MENCEYCDYYRNVIESNTEEENMKAICIFTGTVLYTNDEKPDMEYPCRNVSYQEYLNRKRNPVSCSKLKPENWKFVYKSRHPVAERKRSGAAI